MPTTVRTVSRLWLGIAALLVLVGALVIAVAALLSSKGTAECVNRVLGERATATSIEQTARLAANDAEIAYLRGRITRVEAVRVKTAYSTAMRRAADYRMQHPAGRC